MKTSAILAACASGLAVQAFSVPRIAQDAAQQVQGFMSPEQYLIELAPGETKWVTDAEKWALRREGISFFDITDTPDLGSVLKSNAAVKFPEHTHYNSTVKSLARNLTKSNMHDHLETFTAFHTRYYKSQ
ncbi:MAG: putative uridine permease [Aureobasidium pullulans]|nr:MAG: putative uridine permease [Aureobasidium pullulans]